MFIIRPFKWIISAAISYAICLVLGLGYLATQLLPKSTRNRIERKYF